jgi:hypothetical protein
MLAAFGVDVLDPAVSVRRVHVLLERLPPHARNIGEQWSTEAELIAHLIDCVQYLTWVTLRAHGAKPARPRPVKRPAARQLAQQRPAPVVVSSRADAARELEQGGQVKTGSWGEAGSLLAGLAGVRVRHG